MADHLVNPSTGRAYEMFVVLDPERHVRHTSSVSEGQAWINLFHYSWDHLDKYPNHAPLEEAIRAYTSIGYQVVKCIMIPVVDQEEEQGGRDV